MNTMIRIAFLAALLAMVASCEFFTENDTLEQVKKDPPVAGADTDTDTGDKDEQPDVDNAVTCGNGGIDGTEECDGSAGTASLPCTQLDSNQYSGGTANCSATCMWDRSGCILKTCGDGTVQPATEDCDVSIAEGTPCNQLDPQAYGSGMATCAENCKWDLSACVSVGCGDGTVGANEDCEGTQTTPCDEIDPNKEGMATCISATCKWDTAECTAAVKCGNGTVDTGELCEKNQAKPCVQVDGTLYSGGMATCNDFCDDWLTGNCTLKSTCQCGNGTVDHDPANGGTCPGYDEACEINQTTTCADLALGAATTTVNCKTDCTDWDTAPCIPSDDDTIPDNDTVDCSCGNGVVNTTANGCPIDEICEVSQSTSCSDIGYAGSTLSVPCKNDCTGWDTAMCTGVTVAFNFDTPFILDASKLEDISYIPAHMDAFFMTSVFSGTWENLGPIPPSTASAQGYVAKDVAGGTITLQQSHTQGSTLVSPLLEIFFPDDDITAGGTLGIPITLYLGLEVDQPKILGYEVLDGNTSDVCIKYVSTSGTMKVTEALNTTEADGGALAADTNGVGIPLDIAATQATGQALQRSYVFHKVCGGQSCGDGIINGDTEQCDISATTSFECAKMSADYSGGTATCDQGTCQWDFTNCTMAAIGTVGDLAAQYSGTNNVVKFSWTCTGPGVTNYLFKRSRTAIVDQTTFDQGITLIDDIVTCTPGTTRTIDVSMNWYDGIWYVAMIPYRGGTAGPLSNVLTVDTDAYMSLAPSGGIDFGLVGYNSTKDLAVTVNNTSSLVDLIINETTLPMDCAGKVTMISGAASPAAQVTVVPGAFHPVVLRYAPTETSSCPDGQFAAQWLSHSDDGINFTYGSASLTVTGESANTPPVITNITFDKNPVKNSDGTTQLRVFLQDDNVALFSELDGLTGIADFREIGGDPRESLTGWTGGSGDHHWSWWRNIDASTLGNGIYVIPITVTDSAGHTVKKNATFAVYSGNILEVGDGKTYADILTAVNTAGNYDVIVVYPGTYADAAINPNGNSVTIYGIDGPDNTIINANGGGSHTLLINSDNSGFIFGGFTVTNDSSSAVYIAGGSSQQKVTITNCKFENNSNTTDGGAIEANGSPINITVAHSVFRGNSTPSAGGAVYAASGAALFLVDVLFDDNTALIGGAIATNSAGPLTFDRCTFTGNEGTVQGGALNIVSANGMIEMRNCVVAQNLSGGHGGGLFIDDSTSLPPTVKIYNSTIVENVATYDGGGIIVMKGAIELKDSILFFNQAGSGLTSQLTIYDDGAAPPEVSSAVVNNCAIGGGTNPISDTGTRINAPNGFIAGQQGNIIDDPQFVGGTTGGMMKYRLNSSSPCIDTGSDGSTAPTYDFLGYSRQNIAGEGDGTGIENDMGAFEYQP